MTPSSPAGRQAPHLASLRRHATLDALLPSAFRGLHPQFDDEEEPDRYFYVAFLPAPGSVDIHGGIRVTSSETPVEEDALNYEANLYPEPFFHHAPVPDHLRGQYGNHAFTMSTTDILEKWAVTADFLRIAIQYRPGALTETELWELAAAIHAQVIPDSN